jgi:hypothetical protein
VSFDHLKSQAQALQSQRSAEQQDLAGRMAQTERACETVWRYFGELARQLNVIVPPGPCWRWSGASPGLEMCLMDFRADARRKPGPAGELFDHVALAWLINPRREPAGGLGQCQFPAGSRARDRGAGRRPGAP